MQCGQGRVVLLPLCDAVAKLQFYGGKYKCRPRGAAKGLYLHG